MGTLSKLPRKLWQFEVLQNQLRLTTGAPIESLPWEVSTYYNSVPTPYPLMYLCNADGADTHAYPEGVRTHVDQILSLLSSYDIPCNNLKVWIGLLDAPNHVNLIDGVPLRRILGEAEEKEDRRRKRGGGGRGGVRGEEEQEERGRRWRGG